MKSAGRKGGKCSAAVMEMVKKVELSSFLQADYPGKEAILSRLLTFVESRHTLDQDILYLLQEEGKLVLPEILAPGFLPPKQSRLLLQCIHGLKRAVLRRFQIERLVPFLLEKCHLPAGGEGNKDLDQAVTALQSLNEESLIAVLAEYDGVSTLLALALKPLSKHPKVQTRALDILAQQCLFDSASAKQTFREYHRVGVFSSLASAVVKKQTVNILILLDNAPMEMRPECFAYVETMLSGFPLECTLVDERKELEFAPILLEKVCRWGSEHADRVVDLCVRHGWFPCFAKLLDKDDTLEMLRTFASCASPQELHKKQTLSAFDCVVSKLQRKVSQSKNYEFWMIFFLLSLEDAGIGGCELEGEDDYDEYLEVASVSLAGWLMPDSDAEKPGASLVETLQGVLFVMRKLGWDKTCEMAEKHLSSEGGQAARVGGLKVLVEMARDRNVEENKPEVQRWAEKCLAMESTVVSPTKRQRMLVETTDEEEDEASADELAAAVVSEKAASFVIEDKGKETNKGKETDKDGKETLSKKKLDTAKLSKPTVVEEEEEKEKPAATVKPKPTPPKPKAATTTSTLATSSDPEPPVARVRAILAQHHVTFDTVMEMSLHSFLELNITSQEYYAFCLWLHKLDSVMDDAFVSSLPASPSERAVIREHRDRLLSLKEADWVGLGLKSLTWSRARGLVRARLGDRFNA